MRFFYAVKHGVADACGYAVGSTFNNAAKTIKLVLRLHDGGIHVVCGAFVNTGELVFQDGACLRLVPAVIIRGASQRRAGGQARAIWAAIWMPMPSSA